LLATLAVASEFQRVEHQVTRGLEVNWIWIFRFGFQTKPSKLRICPPSRSDIPLYNQWD